MKAYQGNEAYIFISYAHKDNDQVMAIVQRLIIDGYRVWYDEGITPSETWDGFIANKIKNSQIMLVLFSDNYVSSSNCMDELNYARHCDKKLLPVYLENDVELPEGLEMRINRIQAVFRENCASEDEFFGKLYRAENMFTCHQSQTGNTVAYTSAHTSGAIKKHRTVKYDDGSVYDGELINGKRNGQGKMVYDNGDIYEGGWKDDKRHGQGKMIHMYAFTGCKDVYEGCFENDRKNGIGKMTYHNGDVYEGSWKDDNKSNGKMTYHNGEIYDGAWHDEKRHGQGKMTFLNGNVYEGSWAYDRINYSGKMTYANGEVYDGRWMNDDRVSGKLVYCNGDIYAGEWKNDQRHGFGTMTYTNGDVYYGYWSNNERHGQGLMVYANGDIYCASNITHCITELRLREREAFYMIFRDINYDLLPKNKILELILKSPYLSGNSRMYVHFLSKLAGPWSFNKRHGKGSILCANGEIYDCDWENDKEQGTGKITYCDGSIYEGEWKKRQPHGKGKITYADGTVKKGHWEHGRLKTGLFPFGRKW